MTDTNLKEKALEDLKPLVDNRDFESAHVDADNVLCELLTALGYEEVVAEYEKVGKWYA